jgi:hypothetical protein
MWYCSWLRHYAAIWKAACSILMRSLDFFNWPNPSSCSIVPWWTEHLTETSTRHVEVQ